MSARELFSRVAQNWRRSGIRLLPGVPKASLARQLDGLNRKISRDVLELYAATGGFADLETDQHQWSLWSLPRVVSKNAEHERPDLLFADWSISSWCYCLRYENSETSSVLVDYFDGTEPRVISRSLAEIFRQYLADASAISDATWLNRDATP